MTNAYVVTGERGIYSGWRMWLVAAFSDRASAEAARYAMEKAWSEIKGKLKELIDEEPYTGDGTPSLRFVEGRAAAMGLTRRAFGIEEAFDVWSDDDHKYRVEELPWDTKIAGGIPK